MVELLPLIYSLSSVLIFRIILFLFVCSVISICALHCGNGRCKSGFSVPSHSDLRDQIFVVTVDMVGKVQKGTLHNVHSPCTVNTNISLCIISDWLVSIFLFKLFYDFRVNTYVRYLFTLCQLHYNVHVYIDILL